MDITSDLYDPDFAVDSEEYAKSDPWGKIFNLKQAYFEQFKIASAMGDSLEKADANLEADEFHYYKALDEEEKSLDEQLTIDLKKKKKGFDNTAEIEDDRSDKEEDFVKPNEIEKALEYLETI